MWLLVALPSVALAGCSEDPADTQSDDPGTPANFDDFDLEASETTGILRGVVIDEAIRPLGAVLINVMKPGGGNLTMETEDDGLFGFDDLQPGDYFLTAAKEGFVTIQAAATVIAGDSDPDPVRILLIQDPSTAPFIQPEHLDGFMTCSVRPMFLAYQCGVTDNDIVNQRIDMVRRPDFIQSEMRWDSTQAGGDELSLSIRCLNGESGGQENDPAGMCPEGQRTIVRSEGHSPQIGRINRTLIETWALGGPDGNPLHISLFAFGRSDLDVWDEETIDDATRPATGDPCLYWPAYFPPETCMRATGPGFIVNQKIDVFTHVFYGFTPNEGWTFGADGEHPIPDQ